MSRASELEREISVEKIFQVPFSGVMKGAKGGGGVGKVS